MHQGASVFYIPSDGSEWAKYVALKLEDYNIKCKIFNFTDTKKFEISSHVNVFIVTPDFLEFTDWSVFKHVDINKCLVILTGSEQCDLEEASRRYGCAQVADCAMHENAGSEESVKEMMIQIILMYEGELGTSPPAHSSPAQSPQLFDHSASDPDANRGSSDYDFLPAYSPRQVNCLHEVFFKVMYGLLFLWILVLKERTEGCEIVMRKNDIIEYFFTDETFISFTSFTSMTVIFSEWRCVPYYACTSLHGSHNETFRLVTIEKGAMLIISKLSQDTFGMYDCASKNGRGDSIFIDIVNGTVIYDQGHNRSQNSDNQRHQLPPPRGTDIVGLVKISFGTLVGLVLLFVLLLALSFPLWAYLTKRHQRAGKASDLVATDRFYRPTEQEEVELVDVHGTEPLTENISPKKKISAEEDFCSKLMQLEKRTTLNDRNTLDVKIE